MASARCGIDCFTAADAASLKSDVGEWLPWRVASLVTREGAVLPPLFARRPTDQAEERRIRRLANARHAPASWLERARIVTLSWDGAQLGCHPRTVYRWLHRLNAGGVDDLGDLPR